MLRQRPGTKAVMRQCWRSLLFLHFACDANEVQALLPTGLEIETFPDETCRERAWVGLVPFRMEGVRPVFLPAVPYLSAFPETNVRTYVRHQGKAPGVWFFSLEAGNALACKIARRFFGLPYFAADMSVIEEGDQIEYRSRRRGHGAECNVTAQFQDQIALAEPGSLEFFLIERYLLYALKDGRLYSGRVHHSPYPLRKAHVTSTQESLVKAAGIEPRPITHVCASDGVDVDVFPLNPL